MRVLITGGFGFVGGRLGQYLFEAGHHVVLGSRRMIGAPDWLPEADVACTEWNNLHALRQICSDVDVVVHTAGMNALDCVADPVAAFEFNGMATARLVTAAGNESVRRIIYISTAHVYDSPLRGTITEDTCPRNLHPYATSHRAGEEAVLSAHLSEEIEGIVIRLSNSYGVPMFKDVNCWMLLVNDLCCQAATTRRMLLRSSGVQRRDFVTLTDTCGAILHLLKLPTEKLGNGVFNVGGRASRVIDMAEMIQARCLAVLGFGSEISRPEPSPGETSQELDYRTDKLLSTGFTLAEDSASEIDAILRMCDTDGTLSYE